jgi:hypothetical protein
MIYILILVFLLLFLNPYTIKRLKHRHLFPLFPKEINFGKRRSTFRRALELMESRGAKILIETGVARMGLKNSKSDGASTIVFGKWAKMNGATLHSVDISAGNIEIAKKEVKNQALDESVTFHVGDSVEFLTNFDQKVDFLYLDSYDYDRKDKEIQIRSQEHHLNEFKAVESRLHERSIVLIDDCDLPGGGKGGMLLPYMLEKGWKTELEAYQVLLTK